MSPHSPDSYSEILVHKATGNRTFAQVIKGK